MLMCVFLLVFLNGYGVFHKVKSFSLNHVDNNLFLMVHKRESVGVGKRVCG